MPLDQDALNSLRIEREPIQPQRQRTPRWGFAVAAALIVVLIEEGMVLGVIGGLIGCAFAYFGFNGIRTSTLNWASFSQISFAFAVTSKLSIQGLIYALILAFVGGVMPGIRAARLPITYGLREL